MPAATKKTAEVETKYKDYILPLVPDDPEQPVWSVIRKLSDKIGEGVTTHMRAIARENPLLQGIIDRVDFNATTHGQRDLDDDRLSNLIEAISTKRLGLDDVEADIIGKSYEPSGARQTARQGSPKGERGGANQNLFYNTTAPGIVLFLNRDKPKTRQGKVFLVNASQVFEKGDPSRAERERSRGCGTRRVNAAAFINTFIPEAGIDRIVDALVNWKEEEKFSRIVESGTAERDSASKKTEGTSQVVSEARDNLKKNDYNISPSRYIHTSDAETYRPIAEIVAELEVIEKEAKETDKALGKILKQLGI